MLLATVNNLSHTRETNSLVALFYQFMLSVLVHFKNRALLSFLYIDGWMTSFYVLFNSISVMSGRYDADEEKLCAMELRLRLKRFPPHAGLEPGTARSVG